MPVWDATEFAPASYESSDSYHGCAGYRPTINSYQYGDANAISDIAVMSGDYAIAMECTLREVDLTFYDDGGGVRTPASYDLQYWNGSRWLTVPNQTKADLRPVGNASNRITLPALTTSQLRLLAPNAGGGTGWGLSELRALSRPVFQIDNVNSNLLVGVQGASTANGAQVVQAADDGSIDNLWELEDAGGGYFKLLNLASHLVLGVQGGSSADSAPIQQQADTNAASQLWNFVDTGKGQFQIENKHRSLLLGVTTESTAMGANVVQFMNNGSPDHLWLLKSAEDPTRAEACKQRGGSRLRIRCSRMLADAPEEGSHARPVRPRYRPPRRIQAEAAEIYSCTTTSVPLHQGVHPPVAGPATRRSSSQRNDCRKNAPSR